MKKAICINQIIRNLIIMAFLFWIYKSNDGLMNLMVIPFIVCATISTFKNIFIIFGKDKYVYVLNKLYTVIFLLSAFLFLAFWSYTVIKQKSYIMLLFTIPFWLVLIHFFRKSFFKKETNTSNKSKLKFKLEVIIPCFLVFIVLTTGLYCLVTGIKDTYSINKTTKSYLTTTAYFKDYEIYGVSERWEHNRYKTDTTYTLIYTYNVDDKEYVIKTDYGSSYVPEFNSTRKIKYNPSDPSKAVLVGMNRNNVLIYFGAFFFFGGMIFVLIFLQAKGIFDKVKIDVIGTYVGVLFTIIGIGIILLQNEMTLSFTETLKVMKFWILIPVMFIIVGILQTIKCLILAKKEKNRK